MKEHTGCWQNNLCARTTFQPQSVCQYGWEPFKVLREMKTCSGRLCDVTELILWWDYFASILQDQQRPGWFNFLAIVVFETYYVLNNVISFTVTLFQILFELHQCDCVSHKKSKCDIMFSDVVRGSVQFRNRFSLTLLQHKFIENQSVILNPVCVNREVCQYIELWMFTWLYYCVMNEQARQINRVSKRGRIDRMMCVDEKHILTSCF